MILCALAVCAFPAAACPGAPPSLDAASIAAGEDDSPQAATSAEASYRSAVLLREAGNYDEAIRQLRSATSLKPDYVEAWAELGKCLTKVEDYRGSVEAYERALALAPGDTAYISGLGRGYLFLENLNKAEQYYTELLDRDSLSYDANVHLGLVYQKKNDAEWALDHYRRALAVRPDDVSTIGAMAAIYETAGNEEKRIEYLRRAVAAAPGDERYTFQLGSAYMKRKDFAAAAPLFEDLALRHPAEALYHQDLGLIYAQMPDRKAGAPAELEKALELKGTDPDLSGMLALMYNELKQYDSAAAAAQRGIEANAGQEPLLYYQWAVALSKLERYDEAIAMFEKVVAANDPRWSESAAKQIPQQERLKKVAEQRKRTQ